MTPVSYSGNVSRVIPWFLTFILHSYYYTFILHMNEIRVSTEEKGEKEKNRKQPQHLLSHKITQ